MIRPQPIDLAPWPLGGLLVPDADGAQALAADAVAGLPAQPEGELSFWSLAAADDADGALTALEGLEGEVAAYNRFVLAPSGEVLAELRAQLDGPLAALLEVAAFRFGLRTDLPEIDGLDAELRASALAAFASAAMERGHVEEAAGLLAKAVEAARPASPGLAAQLGLSLVEVRRAMGADVDVQADGLRAAIADTGVDRRAHAALRGELQLELGSMLQESSASDPRRVQEASALFQDAIAGLDPALHPRAHGFAQMRLGLCYMAMPMRDAGDALRMGVATQALKRAVEVLDASREPDLWCSAAANLANAYQLLPSGHLADNLAKAIDLYDCALDLRRGSGDAYGTARLLINKAQAAASLEERSVAIEALEEACPLLAELRLTDELHQARHMMEDLRRQATVAGEAV